MQQHSLNVGNLLTEYLKSDPDYLVFSELISTVLSECKDDITRFTDLIDPDSCPEEFLPLLGHIVGYTYNPRLSSDIQRQVIKNIFKAYYIRGTKLSMINAGTYGNEDYWIGGDLFLPNSPKKTPAELLLTNTRMFTHSKSKFSGLDRFPDEKIWRDGVVQLTLNEVDDRILKEVLKSLPAGMKCYLQLNIDNAGSGDGLVGVSFADIKVTDETIICSRELVAENTYSEGNVFSRPCSVRRRSGRRYLIPEYEIGMSMYSEIVSSDNYLSNVVIMYLGGAERSVTASRSGKYAFDGYFTGDHQIDEVHLDRTPLLMSPLYTIDKIKDMKVGQYGLEYVAPTEIVLEVEVIKKSDPNYSNIKEV